VNRAVQAPPYIYTRGKTGGFTIHGLRLQRNFRILTWLFDSPSALFQFSKHWMSLAGNEELGMDVVWWFGSGIAAGTISMPDASINISVAVCSTRCILLVTSTYLISSFLLAEGQTIVSS
jgi:hypothetical protein